MISLEDQIKYILQYCAGSKLNGSKKIEVPFYPKLSVIVDLGKYPKKPEFLIPKPIQRLIPDFEVLLSRLKGWQKENPPLIGQLIYELKRSIDMLSGIKAYFSSELIQGLLLHAKNYAPNEMFTFLRVVDGLLAEYVMANQTHSTETAAVIFRNDSARDNTLLASCHSHPSGAPRPSSTDLETFKHKPINVIIAYPFTVNSIGVFNQMGELIPFEFISQDH